MERIIIEVLVKFTLNFNTTFNTPKILKSTIAHENKTINYAKYLQDIFLQVICCLLILNYLEQSLRYAL